MREPPGNGGTLRSPAVAFRSRLADVNGIRNRLWRRFSELPRSGVSDGAVINLFVIMLAVRSLDPERPVPSPGRSQGSERGTRVSPAAGRHDDVLHPFRQGQTVLTSCHRSGNSVSLVLVRPQGHAI